MQLHVFSISSLGHHKVFSMLEISSYHLFNLLIWSLRTYMVCILQACNRPNTSKTQNTTSLCGQRTKEFWFLGIPIGSGFWAPYHESHVIEGCYCKYTHMYVKNVSGTTKDLNQRWWSGKNVWTQWITLVAINICGVWLSIIVHVHMGV